MTAAPRIVAVEGLDGAGKSTLVRRLAAALPGATVAKGGPAAGVALRSLVAGTGALYQDVVPGEVREVAHLVELSVQVAYLPQLPGRDGPLVFDRWAQTGEVYCGRHDWHRGWLDRMAEVLPVPRPLLYVRVPPELAAERLAARADPWLERYGAAGLLEKLRRLADRYESVMAGVAHVPIDGIPAPDVVLAAATAAVRSGDEAFSL